MAAGPVRACRRPDANKSPGPSGSAGLRRRCRCAARRTRTGRRSGPSRARCRSPRPSGGNGRRRPGRSSRRGSCRAWRRSGPRSIRPARPRGRRLRSGTTRWRSPTGSRARSRCAVVRDARVGWQWSWFACRSWWCFGLNFRKAYQAIGKLSSPVSKKWPRAARRGGYRPYFFLLAVLPRFDLSSPILASDARIVTLTGNTRATGRSRS